jgi:hypothetical protein
MQHGIILSCAALVKGVSKLTSMLAHLAPSGCAPRPLFEVGNNSKVLRLPETYSASDEPLAISYGTLFWKTVLSPLPFMVVCSKILCQARRYFGHNRFTKRSTSLPHLLLTAAVRLSSRRALCDHPPNGKSRTSPGLPIDRESG